MSPTTLLLPRTLESSGAIAAARPKSTRSTVRTAKGAAVPTQKEGGEKATDADSSVRLLMPVNESASSKAAVSFVASRVALMKHPAHVELINIQYPIPIRVSRSLGSEICKDHYEREANKVLEPARNRLKRAGAEVSTRLVVGTPELKLPEIVSKDSADLVVMSTYGTSGIARLLFGSVAEAIAASTSKPMLILKQEGMARRENLKIGIALDGSGYGVATALFVARHLSLFGANPSVSLIHVAPELETISVPGWIERQVQTGIKAGQAAAMHAAAFESVFAPVHDVLLAAGIEAQEVRLIGHDVSEQIATHAASQKLDVVAMGSLGYGASRLSKLGSVAARVASRIDTHLLLVREA